MLRGLRQGQTPLLSQGLPPRIPGSQASITVILGDLPNSSFLLSYWLRILLCPFSKGPVNTLDPSRHSWLGEKPQATSVSISKLCPGDKSTLTSGVGAPRHSGF